MAIALPKEMQDALDQLDVDADKFIKPFKDKLRARPTPSVIYHYTDDRGLRGILESGCVWLSDMFRMNDPSELRHGFSHACGILSDKTKAGSEDAQVFAELFAEEIANGMERAAHFFICSFSTDGNELGQWRAYADNGRGYVLGFDGVAMEKAFGKDGRGTAYHITYNDLVLAELQKKIVEGTYGLISVDEMRRRWPGHFNADIVPIFMRRLAITLGANALEASLFFKHEAYKNESEYRFRQLYKFDETPPGLKRRYRASEMVKYREFDWRNAGLGLLKEIVVGPAIDFVKGKRFVDDCVAEFHSEPVEVVPSGIPYRAF